MSKLNESEVAFLRKWSGQSDQPIVEAKAEAAYYTMEPREAVGEVWVFKNQKTNGKVVKKHIDTFETEAMARKWYPSIK